MEFCCSCCSCCREATDKFLEDLTGQAEDLRHRDEKSQGQPCKHSQRALFLVCPHIVTLVDRDGHELPDLHATRGEAEGPVSGRISDSNV
jgi:hypothetical protein